MKRFLIYTVLILVLTTIVSCENDNPDKVSIFDTSEVERDSFDRWLLENYTNAYNIKMAYRLEDIETSFSYNVVPAEIEKAKQMSLLMKHLWLEAYEEVALDGVHFVRATVPKSLHLVGSGHHNADGTVTLAMAESGMKITIGRVNELEPYNITKQNYFQTMHHEFAHILHQTKSYPKEFANISGEDYSPAGWTGRTGQEANQLGFVTQYAGKNQNEDFVELIACYATWDRDEWDFILNRAGASGRATIEQKLEIVMAYLRDSWGVDLDLLHEVIQRRIAEVQYMDLYDLGF